MAYHLVGGPAIFLTQRASTMAPELKASNKPTNDGTTVEDQELIDAILATSDQGAFQNLYRRHSPAILRRLHRLIGDPHQAEDALQQVFLEAHKSLAHYRGDGNFSSWLHKIAERVAMKVYKRQWKSRTVKEKLGFYDTSPLPSGQQSQETTYAKQEIWQWMKQILDRISPEHRTVLMLCDLEGKTIDHIAESLSLPRGTVASRLHHARKKVKHIADKELVKQGLSWGDVFDD
ncbi:MAG TPA: hypothetical protein DCE42_05330 [Myxococcales bacterium]|nr:hypothetical protein [Myxococcales bacterium]